MQVVLKNLANEETGKLELPQEIFACEVRNDIVARVVRWQLAKRRSGTHHTKRIGEISGTTRKPFKQKGTGNARQGSLRSPHMRGGATMHGPKFRSHAHKLPKKIRCYGLKSVLSQRFAAKRVLFFEDFAHSGKCADLLKQLQLLQIKSGLFIDGKVVDSNLAKAASNLVNVNLLPVQGANVCDIMKHDILLLSRSAIEGLKERLHD